jgi:hypothetical protein
MKISKLVWSGLAVNIVLATVIFLYLSQDAVFSSYEEQLLDEFISIMLIIFEISIPMQVISLLLLSKAPKAGRVLAFIATVLMLPLSMIFFIGYLFSYEWRYNRGLTPFNVGAYPPLDVSLGFNLKQFSLSGILCIVLGIVIGLLGINVGWVVAAAGAVALINSFRLENRIMVGLSQDKLIITPALYAETFIIPISDVTLIQDKPQSFKLQIKSGGVDRTSTILKRKHQQVEFGKIIAKIATQK